MKTQIIKTANRIIVKVPAELAEPERAIRRAEKKLGVKLVKLTNQVHPLLVYSDRGANSIQHRRSARWSFRISQKASAMQSRACRHARSFVAVDQPGGWSAACKTSLRARLAARYALNPSACTLPPVTPKLP